MPGESIAAFEFATATRLRFGAGTVKELGAAARAFGSRTLLVTGSHSGRAALPKALLSEAGLSVVSCSVTGEPTVEQVRQGTALARSEAVDVVVAFGGGSVIDAAKAIAGLATNPGDPLDYLEVIGRGQPLQQPALPWIAVPTTSGTGAEVTRNAVLGSSEHQVKASLRSPLLLAKLALIDPDLTLDLPPMLTATTGLDALTQLIEPSVCNKANPLVSALCADGIRSAAWALPLAFRDGTNRAAREAMALASVFGGLALANSGLGAVHGFAAPIGGLFPAPHGTVCAVLLPIVMEVNLRALRERQPQHPAVTRYREIAGWLTGDSQATAEQGIEWVRQLTQEMRIPSLGKYGVTEAAIPVLVERGRQASSMKANPISLTTDELTEILSRAI